MNRHGEILMLFVLACTLGASLTPPCVSLLDYFRDVPQTIQKPAELIPPPRQHESWDEVAENFAATLIKAIHTIQENHLISTPEAQMVRWSVDALFSSVKEKVPPEFAKRLGKLDGADRRERLRVLRDARSLVTKRKEFPKNKDVEICLQAVFSHLEPVLKPSERSSYISPEDVKPLRAPAFSGVGLKLESDPVTAMLRVATPVYGGPAYKAGLRAGDLITQIRVDTDANGLPLPEALTLATKGMSVARADELIMGRDGTRVILTVIPARKAMKKQP